MFIDDSECNVEANVGAIEGRLNSIGRLVEVLNYLRTDLVNLKNGHQIQLVHCVGEYNHENEDSKTAPNQCFKLLLTFDLKL